MRFIYEAVLTVTDPAALQAAAVSQYQSENPMESSEEMQQFFGTAAVPNLEGCILELLDPGALLATLPNCGGLQLDDSAAAPLELGMTTKPAPARFEPLDRLETWNADQSWFARQHFAAAGRRFRVTIRRNAYDSQSFARLEALDPAALTWGELVALPFNKQSAQSHVLNDIRPALSGLEMAALRADIATLCERAALLI